MSQLIHACVLLLVSALCVPAASAWRRQESGSFAWLHALFFLNAERGWAVGSGGALLLTTDGGATWKTLRRPTDDALRDLYFADEKRGWLVCERNIYLLKAKDEPRTYLMSTTDGGLTWRRVGALKNDVDVRLVRALFTREGRAWVFGEGGMIYLTRDGGSTWAKRRLPTQRVMLGGAFLSAERGWLVGAGATILETIDGGETWRAGRVLDAVERIRFSAVSFVDDARGWAVGTAGRIFQTVDGGRTWRAQTSGVDADLADVKFLDAREGWAVGAEGTILHTTDGGAHWMVVPSGTTHPLERLFFINRERGWAVGFGGTIIAYGPTSLNPPELRH